jgi:ABC-type bacteriocin/lantibiotic exporter with double-glycine peptidase domain
MNAKAEEHGNVTIAFRAVEYCVPGQIATPILSDITLEVRRGETLVLLGRSGSGKTAGDGPG